jgi:hypothetical protein
LSSKESRLCEAKNLKPEWQPLLNDLDRLQQATMLDAEADQLCGAGRYERSEACKDSKR